MLKIVTGHYHPDLEAALVEEVRQLKSADPLIPFAIIVPSAQLRRRLKWLLCIEHHLSLFDVHVITFHQLALRLLEETGIERPSTVQSAFFFKELVHLLLRRVSATGERAGERVGWGRLAEMPGAWAALWATLKDLKDAGVPADADIARALEAAAEDKDKVAALMALYRAVRNLAGHLRVGDRDDLAVWALPLVATSSLLGRQHRLLYYGFYDLTQVQIDLFHAVVKAYPATLYFPLVKGEPAYRFAEQFFERYLHGMAAGRVATRPQAETSAPPIIPHVMSVSGAEDEITTVAKTILGLVEEQGYAWHEIGVVARTLAGYEQVLPRVFTQQGIPFSSSLGRSLMMCPPVKAVVQLLGLRVHGLRREQVMDVLSSPCIRLAVLCPNLADPRPDLWDLASRRIGIVKGLMEWQRLDAYVTGGLPLQVEANEEGEGPRIPGEQIHALRDAVRLLDQALTFPERGPWKIYTEHARAILHRFLNGDVAPDLWDALQEGLTELEALDLISEETTFADFSASLARLLEERALPVNGLTDAGVQVLDAMEARGIPFRALFVLGLNEKVFPRHIHEDAFLRDHVRRVLDADLGYKIQEKLAGYDEEQLLFSLLQRAARDQLYLCYQRVDATGRPLVPSDYLVPITKLPGQQSEVIVPRRLSDKFVHPKLPAFTSPRLTPMEFGFKALLDRRVPRRLFEEVHQAGKRALHGLETLRAQEAAQPLLGPQDGITGPLEWVWERMVSQGLTPTSLEKYAVCPFRYFAAHVLRLDTWPEPESIQQIGPPERGMLIHQIMAACLKELRARGWFADGHSVGIDPVSVLEETAGSIFAEFARTTPIGYDLVWQFERHTLLDYLKRVLHEELTEMGQGPAAWQPILFESTMKGSLSVKLGGVSEELPLRGRLDRVDYCHARSAYRIIDYKYKVGKHPDTLDRNLALGAVRGLRLQPPLYLMMAQSSAAGLLEGAGIVPAAALTCEGVQFSYLAPNWEHKGERALTRVGFPGDAWDSSLRGPLQQAVAYLAGGVRSGLFFIYPAAYCEQCDFRTICHRTHQASGWRARADHARVQPHRSLRRTALQSGSQSSEAGKAKRGKT